MKSNQQTFDKKYAKIREDSENPTFKFFSTLHHIRFSVLEKYAKKGTSIDLGCGYGKHVIPLLEKGFDVHGLDFSQSLLNELTSSCQKPVKLHFGDIQDMPLKSNSFDFAYSISTLYVVPDQEKAIQEIYRILKPDGVAYLEFGNQDSLGNFESERVSTGIQCTHVPLNWLQAALTRNGFHIFHQRFFQISPLYGSIVPRSLASVFATPYFRQGHTCMLDEAVASSEFLQQYAFRLCMFVSKKPCPVIANRAVQSGDVNQWQSTKRTDIRNNLITLGMRDQLQAICDLFREDPTDALTFYYMARLHIQTESERRFTEAVKQNIDRYIVECS